MNDTTEELDELDEQDNSDELEELEDDEEPQEQQIEAPAEEENNAPSIFSPEGVLVLFVAIMLDLLGIVLLLAPGSGWLTTILGTATIGVWSYIRLGSMSKKKRMKRYLKKFGINGLLEALTAGFYPGWTILVISQLRKS